MRPWGLHLIKTTDQDDDKVYNPRLILSDGCLLEQPADKHVEFETRQTATNPAVVLVSPTAAVAG